MITKTDDSIKRLLLKVSKYIGHSCHKYVRFLFAASKPLSSMEIEILERIFTMGIYSDSKIDSASSRALKNKTTSVIDFNFIFCGDDQAFIE